MVSKIEQNKKLTDNSNKRISRKNDNKTIIVGNYAVRSFILLSHLIETKLVLANRNVSQRFIFYS
jgi:hypothetical protein